MSVKEFKEKIAKMRSFLKDGEQSGLNPASFGESVVTMLEELNLRLQVIERENGPSSAFIDMDEANNRLR
jgi:hypothetical protein